MVGYRPSDLVAMPALFQKDHYVLILTDSHAWEVRSDPTLWTMQYLGRA